MKVTIIIPAYNEAQTIGPMVGRLKALYPTHEILVVDDGSTDDTASAAEAAGARVHRHPYNIGNGAAIKTGVRNAEGDVLVFIDGDGQHDPEAVAGLLEHFPDYDMVVGARQGGSEKSWGRALGNIAYNRLASYVAKFQIEDLTSGFRAIRTDLASQFLYLLPNSYSYPTTLTLSVLRCGRTVKYIPIVTKKRQAGKSELRLIKDGVRFFMIIVKICTLYSPFRIFLPVSLLTFLTGLAYYLYTFVTAGRFTNMSALLFTTSIIIFMMGLISEQVCQLRFERSEGDSAND